MTVLFNQVAIPTPTIWSKLACLSLFLQLLNKLFDQFDELYQNMDNRLTLSTDADENSDSNALNSSPTSPSPGLISYFVNVISGARQTASQEFARFWENLEQPQNAPVTSARNIRTPKSTAKNKNDTSRITKGEHINGRIIPDQYRRGYIKDAEIQTENFEMSIPSLVNKRKASASSYKYDRPLKKQAPSTKGKELNNIDDSICSPSLNTRNVPWTYSLSTNTSPVHKSHLQTRPSTASPERRKITKDIMTGSKSVRRLTHELELTFIPRSPMSPFIKTQASVGQQQDNNIEPTKMDISKDDDITTRMEDIFPMIKPQESRESPIKHQQRLTAKDLDERMEKLEKEVGIAKTKVNQFIAPSSSLSPSHIITSPTRSPMEERRTNDSSKSPSKSTSPPPPPPPQPVSIVPVRLSQIDGIPFSYAAGSPIQSTVRDSMRVTKKYSELKPTDKHKEKMQLLIKMIPDVKLRKTNIIIGPDGIARPNPYWHEIYRR